MYIHAWCQPKCHFKFIHFSGNHPAKCMHQFQIPALRQQCSHRNCSAILMIYDSLRFLRLRKISVFKSIQKISAIDTAVFSDLILTTQTQSRRAVCQHDARHIIRSFFSHSDCLCRCPRNRLSRRAECTRSLIFRWISGC